MPRYRVTLGFIKYTYGPTEQYISAELSQSAITPAIQKLIDLRGDLMSDNTFWAGVRISMVDSKQRSVFYPPGTYRPFVPEQMLTVPPQGNVISSIWDAPPDQAKACLQVRLTYDTDRRCIRYLSLPPDKILHQEPNSARVGDVAFWATRFNTFHANLVSAGWSLRARNRGAGFLETPITNWVQSAAAPTNIGVVVPTLPAPGIAVRDFVSIKGVRRRGTDSLSYNGRYIVHAINSTLIPDSLIYYLRGTETGDPDSVKLLGTVQKIGHTYFPISGLEPLRAGTHKRGKPLGSPRGRSKKRASLDP